MSVYWKEKPEFLRESLSSIFLQTRPANEVILVKDGPLTPELDAVIRDFEKEHAELRVIPLKKNMGLGIALSKGINVCSYDYIARMDSDDICFPQRFEKQIDYLEKHPDIDVIGCWTREFNEDKFGNKHFMSLKKFPNTVWENFKYCTKRCPVEHPAIVIKKKSLIDAGNYQSCYLFEDYNLWARMFVNGAKFYNIPEPLLYFRMTIDSFKRRGGWKYAVSELKALRKFKKIGFFSLSQYWYAVLTRFPIRVMPLKFREFIYKVFLRSNG